jgi:hypothetical protein
MIYKAWELQLYFSTQNLIGQRPDGSLDFESKVSLLNKDKGECGFDSFKESEDYYDNLPSSYDN